MAARNRRQALLDLHGDSLAPVTHAASDPACRVFVQELWRVLPRELVQVGVYYFIDELTHEEIAEVMGVARRTVGYRVKALLREVRKLGGEQLESLGVAV
jgi:DNA-directed RNA polymerase specialized sigma24 family protein